MFIEHPSGAEPYRWRSAPALAFCRAIALCRTLALCRALAFESRVHVRETASVRIYFKGGTDRYTPWGARGVPVAALGFLKARKDTGNGHSAHTGTHTRDREQRLTPRANPPRPRGRRRVTASQPQRPACVRSLARDPPQSVSAASRPIRPNRPSPRMTGAGMRCPAGQDSQRPRRGRGSP